MIARKTKEDIHVDLNTFIGENYAKAGKVARKICAYISQEFEIPIEKKEMGFLAVHIQSITNL